MNILSDQEVIDHLRAKANVLLMAADALEGKPSTNDGLAEVVAVRPRTRRNPFMTLTAEELRAHLKEKSARPADIARALSASEVVVNRLIDDPANGFVRTERGWVKNADDPSLSEKDQ